jgi:hypothetical protein
MKKTIIYWMQNPKEEKQIGKNNDLKEGMPNYY